MWPAALAFCLSLLPYGTVAFVDLSGPLSVTNSLTRSIRASWHDFHESHLMHRRRTVTLRKRDGGGPPKCQLRLAASLNNNTSPARPPDGTSSASSFSEGSTSSSRSSSSTRTSRAGAGSTSSSSSTQVTTTSSGGGGTSNTPTPSPSSSPTSKFNLKQFHNGSSFFDGWSFFSSEDPTGGAVNYLDAATAWSTGLVEINDNGNAVMKVDTTQVVSSNRNSIRINFQESFNGGLLTADIYHMPSACGAWPAWWTNGPDWPTYGEIDIVEGVHLSVANQAALHTAPGCTMPNYNTGFAGNAVNGNNCASTDADNTGCGILSTDQNSFGTPFNDAGGGVYAMLWDDSGIRIWLFHRGSIPSDLSSDNPFPETWPTPMASFPSTNCNPWQYMQNHIAIFDTTLCGDWAGSAGSWGGSCAASTGYATCVEYVQNEGAAFASAYWEVNSVKLYQ